LVIKQKNFYNLLPFLLIFMSVSFDYHVTWIIFDLYLISYLGFRLFLNFKNNKINANFVLMPVLLFCIFFIVIFPSFYSILSLWDIFKYLILINLLNNIRYEQLCYKNLFIYTFNIFLFVQYLFVIFQYLDDIYIDNISGTLGDGMTHALGYLGLFVFFLNLATNQKKILHFLSLLIIIHISIMNSSPGVIWVLITTFVALLFNFKFSKKQLYVLFILFLLFFLNVLYNDSFDRILSIFKGYEEGGKLSRFSALIVNFHYAEWLGFGPGYLSNIYGFTSYDERMFYSYPVSMLTSSQSQLMMIELGMIGFIFTGLIYTLYIYRTTQSKVGVILFLVSFFYCLCLTNEMIAIFMFMIIYLINNVSFKKLI
jgi:hypothetical protein